MDDPAVPPDTTEAAATDFVTAALRAGGVLGPDTVVATIHHERIAAGRGLVGSLARLRLEYDGGPPLGAPASVVLKIPTAAMENRAQADAYRLYEREGRFYRELAAVVPVRTPRCYWNHIDPGSGAFGLLLEDLGGYLQLGAADGIDVDRADAALATAAGLHTATAGLARPSWMPRLDDPGMLSAGAAYRLFWPTFLEQFGAALPQGALQLGERVGLHWEELACAATAAAPAVICHADFKADNLFFDDHATGIDRVVVTDWQMSWQGPAVSDIALLLALSMTVEDRRRHEVDLVRGWVQRLTMAGSEYPFQQAWTDYRRMIAVILLWPVVVGGAGDLANETGRSMLAGWATRAVTAALDLDVAQLLP